MVPFRNAVSVGEPKAFRSPPAGLRALGRGFLIVVPLWLGPIAVAVEASREGLSAQHVVLLAVVGLLGLGLLWLARGTTVITLDAEGVRREHWVDFGVRVARTTTFRLPWSELRSATMRVLRTPSKNGGWHTERVMDLHSGHEVHTIRDAGIDGFDDLCVALRECLGDRYREDLAGGELGTAVRAVVDAEVARRVEEELRKRDAAMRGGQDTLR